VAFDAALELLIAIMRQPHRMSGKEHSRQCDVHYEGRVVPAAKTATHIREMRFYLCGSKGLPRLAEKKRH
jgi:hypothetical protein